MAGNTRGGVRVMVKGVGEGPSIRAKRLSNCCRRSALSATVSAATNDSGQGAERISYGWLHFSPPGPLYGIRQHVHYSFKCWIALRVFSTSDAVPLLRPPLALAACGPESMPSLPGAAGAAGDCWPDRTWLTDKGHKVSRVVGSVRSGRRTFVASSQESRVAFAESGAGLVITTPEAEVRQRE